MVKKSKAKERRMASARDRADTHKSGFDSNAIKLPEGVKFYKLKEGSKKWDIIPYEAGKGNPHAKPGELYYERTFYTHPRIGPDESTYVCPRKTWGKKCPICEHRMKLAADPEADEAAVKALNVKERQIFALVDHANRDDGVQILEISFHCFGRALDKKVRNGDEGEYDFWFDPEDGYYIRAGVDEDTGGDYKFMNVGDIEFKKRKEALDEDVLASVPCLDDLLIEYSYDELKKIFLQIDEDEDEDEKPKKGKDKAKKKVRKGEVLTAKTAGLEVGDTVEHEEHGTCEIVKISKDGTSLTLEDEDGEKINAIAVDEVTKSEEPELEDDEPEEEEEKPVKRGRGRPPKSAPSKKKPDPEEDDDEIDSEIDDEDEDSEMEEEEEPTPKKGKGKAAKSSPKKPSIDDEDEEIDDSDDWDDSDDDDEPEPPKKKGRK